MNEMQWAAKQKGFTIVELLIVVVVIAILAAITIVAYNGIQNRAKSSAVESTASQAGRKALLYAPANNDQFPTESTFRADLGFPADSTQATYHYYVSEDRKAFCLSVTDASSTPISYAMTQAGDTFEGRCIKNLAINPSLESGVSSPWGGPNGSVVAASTAQKYSGDTSAQVTMPVAGSSAVGVNMYSVGALGATDRLQPNTTYTISVYVYVPTGSPDLYISVQGTGFASLGAFNTATVKNQWTELRRTFTTGASGNIVIYTLNSAATTTAGLQFWVDGLNIVEGNAYYSYGGVGTPGWNAVNATSSTASFGPATLR